MPKWCILNDFSEILSKIKYSINIMTKLLGLGFSMYIHFQILC